MTDVVIIGAGPAGISAALYAARANLSVTVLYTGAGNLEKAHKIENYYGFPGGISGQDLFNAGIAQARALGADVRLSQVTDIQLNDDMTFTVAAAGADGTAEIPARAVVIATGNKKLRPPIAGIEQFEGKGVSYCAICDAFFYRKKNVAVIGNGTFALSEAAHLAHVAGNVTILTNGLDAAELESAGGAFTIDTRKIAAVTGDGKVSGVEFADGGTLALDGIFVALGEAGASDFAKKLGIQLAGDSITVNEKMETNVPGVFSCGNATGGLLQVCKAVYEGGQAGLSAVSFVRGKR